MEVFSREKLLERLNLFCPGNGYEIQNQKSIGMALYVNGSMMGHRTTLKGINIIVDSFIEGFKMGIKGIGTN